MLRAVIAWSLLLGGVAAATDPPKVIPSDTKPKDEKSKEKKRPTTEAEFEALAKEGPKPPWLPSIGINTLLPDKVRGTVVAVSADAIEVRPEGKKETVKYPPHTLLATGAVCHWEGDARCYLLDDVQKGDEVMVAVGTVDKEKGPEAWYLSIQKRPGGVVPASRKPSYPNAYHLRRQEQVEADERGGLTPQDIKDDIEKRKLAAEKGLPPPPPLKPPENPPKKKD